MGAVWILFAQRLISGEWGRGMTLLWFNAGKFMKFKKKNFVFWIPYVIFHPLNTNEYNIHQKSRIQVKS